jgi:hypothetical protein
LGHLRNSAGTPPPWSRARAYGARKRGQRRKAFGPGTLLFGNPWSYPRLFVLLRKVMCFGAAHFDNLYFIFLLLAASKPPRHCAAPLTALLAGRPPMQRLTGSELQLGIARAAARPSAAETGGFGSPPQLRQSNSHARRRKPSRAQWPGRAQQSRGHGGLSQLRHNTKRPRAKENKRSGQAERRGDGNFGDLPRQQ